MTTNRLAQWRIGDLAAARCIGSLALAAAALSLVAIRPAAAIAMYCLLMGHALFLLARSDRRAADVRVTQPHHRTGAGSSTAGYLERSDRAVISVVPGGMGGSPSVHSPANQPASSGGGGHVERSAGRAIRGIVTVLPDQVGGRRRAAGTQATHSRRVGAPS